MLARAPVSAQSSPQGHRTIARCGLPRSRLPGVRDRLEAPDPLEDLPEEILRQRDLSQLERDVAVVADHRRADLDELVPQRGQAPVTDPSRKHQPPQEIAQVVGEREQLEPNGVVEEGVTGEPRPVECDLALEGVR